jgi:phospholipid transport system substrate-binding protein
MIASLRLLAATFALLAGLSLTPAHAIDPAPAQPIAALNAGLLAAMHAGQSTPYEQRYAALAPIVERTFDLQTILETSVGPKWQTFTPAQQDQLRSEFTRFTVASYLANFSSFGGERFEVSPDLRAVGAEQVVETKIIPLKGDAARIDYVMRQEDPGWRAVDVLLDGSISRVAVQRSDFRHLVESGPEPLIESLQKKSAMLAAGKSKS